MANKWRPLPLLLTAALASALASDVAGQAQDGFFGKYIGKLKSYHHGVSGDVFAVDSRTLHIRDFTYDGEGPAAYFYVGTSKSPGPNGIRIADEKGSDQPLSPYKGKHITLTLPETSTLNTIKWFSVWCDEYTVNFGDVRIPKNLEYPKPQKIEGLNGVHAVSSDSIVIVDAQTLLIPNFSYDGEAPDAKFWVGRGAKPSPQGVRVPDENGQEEPLRRYDRKTIVLTLPGDLTVFDIGHFGVWCEAFAVDFGHVRLPTRGLNVPPSLRMLGVSPQSGQEPATQQQPRLDLAFSKPHEIFADAPANSFDGRRDAPPQQQQQQHRLRLAASTYRPPSRAAPATSVQIVPSIAVEQFQEPLVEARPPHQGQASFAAPRERQFVHRDDARAPRPQARSFSRFSISGASGATDTFVTY